MIIWQVTYAASNPEASIVHGSSFVETILAIRLTL
jgi:hypothetical protein